MIRRRHRCDNRVIFLVAARCLDYPTAELLDILPDCTAALDEQGTAPAVQQLRPLLAHLGSTPLDELQRDYVELFDLSGKHALYLSYWTDGDTRRRGEVLTRFLATYRAAGAQIDYRGELPDYLPILLEFSARVDPRAGGKLLSEYRPSLEFLKTSLEKKSLHYAGAVSAVCAVVPAGPSPTDDSPSLHNGPPIELVGIETYGVRS